MGRRLNICGTMHYSTDWWPGEPNNMWDAEDCVEMVNPDDTDFKWNDVDCSNTDKSTICEIQYGDYLLPPLFCKINCLIVTIGVVTCTVLHVVTRSPL